MKSAPDQHIFYNFTDLKSLEKTVVSGNLMVEAAGVEPAAILY